jgi:hypothetical protein
MLTASLGNALLELLNHVIEIGITCAKAFCEPVSTALGNPLSIGEHLELTGSARRNRSFDAKTLLNQGHETRDLGFIVLSRRAGTYFNLHSVLQPCLVLWRNPMDETLSRNLWSNLGRVCVDCNDFLRRSSNLLQVCGFLACGSGLQHFSA